MHAEYTVDGDDWVSAIDRLCRLTSQAGDAETAVVVDFACDLILISYGRAQVCLPAMGYGEGTATLAGALLPALIADASKHAAGEMLISVVGQVFDTRTLQAACDWSDARPAEHLLWSPEALPALLRLRHERAADDIAALGLDDALYAAEAHKSDLVVQAAEILAPLGITSLELEHFVARHLKNQDE